MFRRHCALTGPGPGRAARLASLTLCGLDCAGGAWGGVAVGRYGFSWTPQGWG